MNFSIKLADDSEIVWEFVDKELKSVYDDLNSIMVLDEKENTREYCRILLKNNCSIPKSKWNQKSVITRRKNISARFLAKYELEIVCHEFHQSLATVRTRITLIIFYGLLRLILDGHGTIIHGALLNYCGNGVIIIGASGTGKSTCARRVPAPWENLSDDAILVTHFKGIVYAQPLPTFSQLTNTDNIKRKVDTSKIVQLKKIYRLKRGNKPHVEGIQSQISRYQQLLMSQCDFLEHWGFEDDDAGRQLAEAFSKFSIIINNSVCLKELYCSLTGEFWGEIEKDFLIS